MTIRKWSKKGAQSPTHVLMDGGQLYVPDADTDTFLNEYVSSIFAGQKLYVVEQKTERFKFFVDVDFKSAEPLGDEEAFELCTRIQESVGGGRCLVARAPPRAVKDGIKSGIHMHWPELVVTRNDAMALRTRILLELDHESWANIIDSSVYGGSGLRCLWSHKKPEGEPYVPWRSVPDGAALSTVPSVSALKLFSVRTENTETVAPTRSRGPRPQCLEEQSDSKIEEFIRRNMEGQAAARVKQIRKTKKGEGKGLCVETDSRYCENIHAEHRSNHVWFWILGGTIQQMCLDEECTGFVGRKHILPPSISNEASGVARPAHYSAVDLLPPAWRGSFQGFRAGGAPVLGSGPPRMEVVPDGN
jgi:hypothetical protein